jgi:hypothetical protein
LAYQALQSFWAGRYDRDIVISHGFGTSVERDQRGSAYQMPNAKRLPSDLQRDFHKVCDVLIRTHYFEEVNWLWMASASPSLCTSDRAREVLQNAAGIVQELRFPRIAEWLQREVLQDP